MHISGVSFSHDGRKLFASYTNEQIYAFSCKQHQRTAAYFEAPDPAAHATRWVPLRSPASQTALLQCRAASCLACDQRDGQSQFCLCCVRSGNLVQVVSLPSNASLRCQTFCAFVCDSQHLRRDAGSAFPHVSLCLRADRPRGCTGPKRVMAQAHCTHGRPLPAARTWSAGQRRPGSLQPRPGSAQHGAQRSSREMQLAQLLGPR